MPTVDAAYAAIDIARHNGVVAGTIAADFVISKGVSRERLAALTDDMVKYPGMESARWVVAHADQRAESPLETLGRLAFLTCKRDPPLSNVWMVAGSRHYRVDHFIPSTGVILEADGALKYNNRPDANWVVTQEKNRERDLRALGFEIVRYDFDLAIRHPAELVRRADVAARLRIGRPVPDCWNFEPPSNMWRQSSSARIGQVITGHR